MRAATVGVGISVVAGACAAAPEIDRSQPARIYDMEYDDRDYLGDIKVCTQFDDDFNCTSSVTIPRYDEEHYWVDLAQCPNLVLPFQTDETCIVQSFDVPESNFGQLAVGNAVRFNDQGDLVRLPR